MNHTAHGIGGVRRWLCLAALGLMTLAAGHSAQDGAPAAGAPETSVDVARFGRVVTWDPARADGCRASRIEEFRKEDVFLDTDLLPRVGGGYAVPVTTNGLGCIGLQWLNRRDLDAIGLEFANPAQVPPASSVRVEGWFGESAWQGAWKPLAGVLETGSSKLVFHVRAKAELAPTQKIRWVFPATDRCLVRSLSAFTRSQWDDVQIVIEAEKPARNARGAFTVYNGELTAGSPGTVRQEWTLSQPLHVTIRYSRASSFKSDPTVLQFRLPKGALGVAIDDVLANQCVYVPEDGLFVACESAHLSLADYKAQIAGRKTVLAQVRQMPDQTLAQAMAKTRHEVQDKGPVMLSLACDNVKFTVAREGTIEFATSGPLVANEFASNVGAMHSKLGSGAGRNLQRHLEGDWLPIPVITVESGGILYTQRTFVAPCDVAGAQPTRLNRQSVCVAEFTARNPGAAPAEATCVLSFPENLKAKTPAQLGAAPRGYWVSGSNGPLALIDTNGVGPLLASVSGGSVTFHGTLPAETTARCVVYFPGVNLKAEDIASLPEPTALVKAVAAYWQAALAPAMQVEIPDRFLLNVIRSSQVRCLIDARSEADGARIAPWIAAMAYGPLESESHSVIRGMDLMGHRDFAQRGLDYFIHRYNAAGFLTTGYTVFGTGWHLWTLGEHYQLDHDTEWFAKVAPEVERVGQWICRQLDKTRQRDTGGRLRPEFGLMPPGVLADWNAFAYHYCMNAYYYAALRETGLALRQLRHPSGEKFLAQAAELRANLLRAYAWTQSQTPVLPLRDGTWVPAYVSQVHSPGKLADFFPGQDAGRSWCYDVELGAHQLVPTGVLSASGPEVTQMMQHMEDVQFLADGWFDYPAAANHADWFNQGGFSKVQPYYTRNAEIYALRDDVKPFVRSYFNTLAAMLNTETLTVWEHFHNNGAWDKTHETGYFLQQTRFMLVMEHEKELWLAPLLTSNWFKPGMTVAVANAPTRFGKVSYRIQSHTDQGYIEATVDSPDREAPRKLVLRLRHPEAKPVRSVAVNGKRIRSFDPLNGTISLKPQRLGPITVRADY